MRDQWSDASAAASPGVIWRAGLDLNPLDIDDAEAMAWLEQLVWPEHDDRRTRLAAAVSLARQNPPKVFPGDLTEALERVVEAAPRDATLVIFHSAVLAYVERSTREAWVDLVTALPGHWISNEAPTVLPEVAATAACSAPHVGDLSLALDGRCVAWTQGHGRSLHWC